MPHVYPLLKSLGVAKGKYVACSVWIGLMRSTKALLVHALNFEKFTSPHFKNEFSVLGILCVHILKQIFPSVVIGTQKY